MEQRLYPPVRYVAVARLSDRHPIAHYSPPPLPVAGAEEPLARLSPPGTPPPSIFIDKVTRVLRSKRVSEHARLTITDRDVGHIHFDSSPTHLFLVIAATSLPQRGAFKLLAELMRDFVPPDRAPAEPWGASAATEGLLATVVKRHNGRSRPPPSAAVAGTDTAVGGGGGRDGKEPAAREVSLSSSSSTTLSSLGAGGHGSSRTAVSVDFPSEWEKGVPGGGGGGVERVVGGDERRALDAAAAADARSRRALVIAIGVGALLILVGGPLVLWK
ncbi:hypothetical protein I4F81_001762 [Pyropia yezoensis]|uniref:Uncharacterized protein n=1 Tax=Pyropia yezoensis TaxID=2788 RepID=A0ACC3BML1_PYRYE|nr:hypothetical protein I4F81_001762 [Neopyropia yezoensis]